MLLFLLYSPFFLELEIALHYPLKALNTRLKVLLLSNFSLLALILGIAIGMRQPILQQFAALEQNLMQKKLARVADGLMQRVEKLDSSAKAEATWTEMYDYMTALNSSFYRDTYTYEGLATASYDVFGLINRAGQSVHLDWVDRRSCQLTPLSPANRDALLKEQHLTHFPADDDPALGGSRNLVVVETAQEPMLVVARPILTSDAKGPKQGTLVMGVFMTQDFLNQLEKHSDLQLQLVSATTDKSIDQSKAQDQFESQEFSKTHSEKQLENRSNSSRFSIDSASDIIQISPDIRALNDQFIEGKIDFLNGDRQPIQTLLVRAQRLEYQQGKDVLNQLSLILLGLGFSLGVVITFLLDKAVRSQELLHVSQVALENANQELQQLANLDGLTQIANRRFFEQFLQMEWNRAMSEKTPMTMILCDVDHFKRFNDTYGHPMGDKCLIQVAQAIRCTLPRSTDLVARYGGEEFAVVLPNTDLDGGLLIAESIQSQVRKLQITDADSSICVSISVSLGVATAIPTPDSLPEMLIRQSDKKLYTAKEQGRDRIVFC